MITLEPVEVVLDSHEPMGSCASARHTGTLVDSSIPPMQPLHRAPLSDAWLDFLAPLARVQDAIAGQLDAYHAACARLESGAEPGPIDGVAAPCEREAFDVCYYAARYEPRRVAALATEELKALASDPSVRPWRRLSTEFLVGCARYRSDDAPGGLLALDACEERIRALGDPHLLLRAVTELARSLAVGGEPYRAVVYLHEAIDLARRTGDRMAEAQNLMSFGFVYGERGEPEPYARLTREALTLYLTLDDPYGLAMAHCNLAGALSKLGSSDEAAHHYGAARALAAKRDFAPIEALCLAGEGGILCERGELEAGSALYEQSNRIFERLGNRFQITRHLHLLGEYHLRAGQFEAARRHLVQAVESGRTGAFRATLLQSLDLLATAAEALGDHPLAVRCLRERSTEQQRVFDTLLDGRIHAVEERHKAESARQEAEFERRKAEELRRVNADLRVALDRQRDLQDELVRLSYSDPLTRLSNRRHLRELLDHEMARTVRRFRPLSILLVDVDHFKSVNDLHGHEVGDQVLVELASRLRTAVRVADAVGRWGGEEFCVVLFETDAVGAMVPAENLRARIAGTPFHTRAGEIRITVSVGVATLQPDVLEADDVLRRADRALYDAKRAGRDRVVLAAG